MHPYRSVSEREKDRSAVRPCAQGTRDLLAPFAFLWVLSLVRVAYAFAARRMFGARDTLALITLVLLPWLLFGRRSGGRST